MNYAVESVIPLLKTGLCRPLLDLPASSTVATVNPDRFIKTSSHKFLTRGRIVHVQYSWNMVHVHVDWLVKTTNIKRVQIRILIGCCEDERLKWIPGHCVAPHLHDNLTEWGRTAHIIKDNAAIGSRAGKQMGLEKKNGNGSQIPRCWLCQNTPKSMVMRSLLHDVWAKLLHILFCLLLLNIKLCVANQHQQIQGWALAAPDGPWRLTFPP